MLRVVTGASGSGKSRYAEDQILSLGSEKRYYIATMMPWDEECRERIRRHRRMREGKGFETLECPLDLDQARVEPGSAVLIECLSNLTANEFFREDRDLQGREEWKRQTEERIFAGILRILDQAADVVVVTNEIFSDGTVYSRETMDYMEVLGRLNVRLAGMAKRVTEVVFGIPLEQKGPEREEGEAL